HSSGDGVAEVRPGKRTQGAPEQAFQNHRRPMIRGLRKPTRLPSSRVTERPRYSFVVPVFNEEETLPELERRVTAVIDGLDGPAEVILVDDGSVERTAELAADLNRRDPRFKLLRFTRNFGHQMAITAGLDHAQGDAVVIMDGDLQDPPEVVPELIARWREGYEVVYAIRQDRSAEPW